MQHQKMLLAVGRSARLKVLNELKRTPAGLHVRDLAVRLHMSYMGVKDLCLDLEKRGFLDTWRQAQKRGRPHLLYRLTERAQELFPKASNELTLELLKAAQRLFGPSAAEKLLLVTFQTRHEEYLKRVRGDTLREKVAALVRIREGEGCLPEVLDDRGELRIVEHHSPIRDLLEAYPAVAKLETDLFQSALGVPVRREESRVSGLYCATFHLGPADVVSDATFSQK